ncbi:MAG: TerB N-terminal domain-containing protein [Microthrixaceae bacterium]|nr:TerB N-terminal domain-containing protein [Microthrixaceae bacterium]
MAVTVAGRQIPGGMIYVGTGVASAAGHGIEPALIDPRLRVDWARPDWQGLGFSYWPSYDRIPEQARAAYLSWLAGTRDQPVQIGYVFLYFYGLERRALTDLGISATDPELELIVAEVNRLLAIYGPASSSFDGYASSFLNLLSAVKAVHEPISPPDHHAAKRSWEIPLTVRIGLGRFVAAGRPIPASWALSLVRTHPEAYLRTPAKRCPDEFDALFKLRYCAKYGDGMVVAAPKATVSVTYRPASAGFRGQIHHRLEAIPDITGLAGPINKLREIAGMCTDELDAYSRFVGRHPESKGSPRAVGLLPADLVAGGSSASIGQVRDWVQEHIAKGPSVVSFDDLVELWSPGHAAKLVKADAVSIASLVEKFGAGVEPDVRFGAATPKPGSTAVLFPQSPGAPAAPSPGYSAAATLVHLTAVVAAADGSVSPEERAQVADHIETVLGLNEFERSRLNAHLLWLTAGKPALGGMKRRLEALTAAQRASIGRLLVDVAAADGQVTPDEITTLTKVYRLLCLDEADVYRTVHALASGDAGPPTVRPAEHEKRWSIPAAPTIDDIESPVVAVRLDPEIVAARLAETATVTALLADIFTDDEPETDSASHPAAEASVVDDADVVPIEGLDGAHSALAHRLRSQSSWDRSEAGEIAASLGLPLLDGALDRINEAALDLCGDPLVEGDDPLEINHYAVEELFQ